MPDETMLYHGLPAVMIDDGWVIISADFTQIAKIDPGNINFESTYQDLLTNGFFSSPSKDPGIPEVSLATLITTSDCNLRCRYCFANSGDTRKDMPFCVACASVRRAIRNAAGRKLSIAFFGGEPTLTPHLIKDTVAYAKQQVGEMGSVHGVEFSITTNGVMPDSFLDFLIEENFLVTLSADGAPEVQDFQRPTKNGQPSSAVVARSIRRLAEAGVEFKIRATVTEYSVSKMVEMVEWTHEVGGKQVHFEPLSIAGRALKTKGQGITRPAADEFIANLKSAINRGNELDVGVINSSFMNMMNPPREFCEGSPKHRFAATYEGEITTCVEVQDRCHPVSKQFIVGRYDETTKEIVTIKDRERATACAPLVSIQRSGTDSPCRTCFAQRICGGGCPVRNFHMTGDSAAVDPYRCQTVREMIPYAYRLFFEESGHDSDE